MAYERPVAAVRGERAAGGGWREGAYVIAVVCEDDCTEADLALFGPDGRRLAADLKKDDAPMVTHVPAVTGQYTLRVAIRACSAEPCAYGLQIYGEN